jgi:hypothetical protein
MRTQLLNRAATQDQSRSASLALEYGIEALAEAEHDGATGGEIIRLCDEVIIRRLRVQTLQMRAGSPASSQLIAQMARDWQLLDQPSILDD